MITTIGTVVTILGVASAAAVVVVAFLDARAADKSTANEDALPVVKVITHEGQSVSGSVVRKYEVQGFAGFYRTVREDDASPAIELGELVTVAHDGSASN
jgi:hypothetical protein